MALHSFGSKRRSVSCADANFLITSCFRIFGMGTFVGSTVRFKRFGSTPYFFPSCAPLKLESFQGLLVSASRYSTIARSSSSVMKSKSKKCPDILTAPTRFIARAISANASFVPSASTGVDLPTVASPPSRLSIHPPAKSSFATHPVARAPVCALRPLKSSITSRRFSELANRPRPFNEPSPSHSLACAFAIALAIERPHSGHSTSALAVDVPLAAFPRALGRFFPRVDDASTPRRARDISASKALSRGLDGVAIARASAATPSSRHGCIFRDSPWVVTDEKIDFHGNRPVRPTAEDDDALATRSRRARDRPRRDGRGHSFRRVRDAFVAREGLKTTRARWNCDDGRLSMALAIARARTSTRGVSAAQARVRTRSTPTTSSRRLHVTRSAADAKSASAEATIEIDTTSEDAYTVIRITDAPNKPGTLRVITTALADLGLNIEKAIVDSAKDDLVSDIFHVTDSSGSKVTDAEDVENIKVCLSMILRAHFSNVSDVARPDAEISSAPQGSAQRRQHDLLYSLMDRYLRNDVMSVQESIVNHVEYTMARNRYHFDDFEAYNAAAFSVRDRLIESWNDTQQHFRDKSPKRVYYLSMEFLMGRSFLNSLYNLDIKPQFTEALHQLGYDMENLVDKERDAALGNGGLGRLASCFLDSMATQDLPAWGYGIRYQYGMFRQTVTDGFQHEHPDYWLNFGNPWEIERPYISYPVKFYGGIREYEIDGVKMYEWLANEEISAVAYDNPIPGWDTPTTINLRLWSAKPSKEFDLESFNTGDYVQAILSKQRAETISSVLYPDDRTYQGKELRLKQQYFMVSATLQDIIRRYLVNHQTFDQFPDQVAIQLNDTHPSLGIPELMRLFLDEHKLGWTKAWDITSKVFSVTNHTVLAETLEKWPVDLMEKVLPRHMMIIYDINWRFIQELAATIGEDYTRIGRMSIIEEAPDTKYVRMAHLALVACHTVNGVAEIHSELLKSRIFADFYNIMPEKFQNKTNGVTQRRWLAFSNPELRDLISSKLGGDAWIRELESLHELEKYADNAEFQAQWRAIKTNNKKKLAKYIEEKTGTVVNPNALFDIQVKRIHEYKRQLLNVFYVIHKYKQIKAATLEERKDFVPRVVLIGGKAAPGYDMAKRIIKLVCSVGDVVNNDPDVGDLLKIVFVPDYNVSSAETIVPAAELSQHISTAGTEASGTSNMKFAMNGCLIIGTMDGSNVEIAEEIGKENMFIFGSSAADVPILRAERARFKPPQEFDAIVESIREGAFGWVDYFAPLCEVVHGGADYYLLANDFEDYCRAQSLVDETYKDEAKWTKMSIKSTARSGKFSSDRTIREYAKDIWGIEPCRRVDPGNPR